MRYSIRFSDAIHILSYIEIFQGTDLSSEMLAKSIETNAANVRKIMSQLRKAELIETQPGKAAPTLARKPEQITLYDVYYSIEGDTNLIEVDPKTNPACLVGGNIQEVLTKKYAAIQKVVDEELKKTSIADIIHDIAVQESLKRPENKEIIERFL